MIHVSGAKAVVSLAALRYQEEQVERHFATFTQGSTASERRWAAFGRKFDGTKMVPGAVFWACADVRLGKTRRVDCAGRCGLPLPGRGAGRGGQGQERARGTGTGLTQSRQAGVARSPPWTRAQCSDDG